IGAMLGAADIPVRVQLQPADAVHAAHQTGAHEIALAEAAVIGGDPHLLLFPLSTSEGARPGAPARNFSFYRNPRLDDVLIRASAAWGPRRGGTLRRCFVSDPPTLDPAHATDLTSSSIIHQVFDALLELDETLVPAPALAERWSVSTDHRVYTFHLRRGAKFHNGREVRAAGVKYSLAPAGRRERPWVFDKL